MFPELIRKKIKQRQVRSSINMIIYGEILSIRKFLLNRMAFLHYGIRWSLIVNPPGEIPREKPKNHYPSRFCSL